MGPISTDMYLPAFPAIEAEFHAPPGAVQQTIAAWFIGLALGQMVIGALSDRLGRRGPMLAGLALCTVASVGCALAPDLFDLCGFRLIAALGGGASSVIPRAVVRDVATGHSAARMMARLMLISGVAPIAAPPLGAMLLTLFGWRFIFWACAAHGALAILAVWRFLPDTLPPEHRQHAAPSIVARRYATVLADPGFLAYGLVVGLGMFTIFSFISGSPVMIPLYGISPTRFGMLFVMTASCFMLSSQLNARLLRRYGGDAVVLGAALLALTSAALLLAVALEGRPPIALTYAALMGMSLGIGLTAPTATISAMTRHAGQAATASAVLGTIQFVMAALAGMVAGWLADGTLRPMAIGLTAGTVALCLTFLIARRAGEGIVAEP